MKANFKLVPFQSIVPALTTSTPTPGPKPTPGPTPTPRPTPGPKPTPTPKPAPSADASCASTTLPGPLKTYPDATTTGVPAGTSLTSVNGDYHTQSNGEVVSQRDVSGTLFVDHDDVKIKCTHIGEMVEVNGGNTGMQMWLSTVGNPTGAGGPAGVRNSDFTLRRVEILGTTDGMRIYGNVDVQDSYIHDLYSKPSSSQSSGWTHNDGAQISGGDNTTIKHNTFDCWSFREGQSAGVNLNKTNGDGYMTSCFMIVPGSEKVTAVIDDNIIRGRASKYLHINSNAKVQVTNNKFGRENRDYPNLCSCSSSATWSGNTFLDNGEAAE